MTLPPSATLWVLLQLSAGSCEQMEASRCFLLHSSWLHFCSSCCTLTQSCSVGLRSGDGRVRWAAISWLSGSTNQLMIQLCDMVQHPTGGSSSRWSTGQPGTEMVLRVNSWARMDSCFHFQIFHSPILVSLCELLPHIPIFKVPHVVSLEVVVLHLFVGISGDLSYLCLSIIWNQSAPLTSDPWPLPSTTGINVASV